MTSGLQTNAVNTLESKSQNKKIGGKTYVDVGKLFLEKGSCTIEMKPANWTHEMEHTYHPIHPSTPTLPVGPSFGMAFNVINESSFEKSQEIHLYERYKRILLSVILVRIDLLRCCSVSKVFL